MSTSSSDKDQIYAQPRDSVPRFCFDASVAAVFPDMIQRSVPGYAQIIDMLSLLANCYAQPNSRCYDLGCSLGAASYALSKGMTQPNCQLIAVDNSEAMIAGFQQRLQQGTWPVQPELICADIQDVTIKNASIVVLNFTLQFIPVAQRQTLLHKIYQGLLPGGVLVLSEKLAFEKQSQQLLMTELHHRFKQAHGYSVLEISQKRQAIENVLVPETLAQHQQRLQQVGFAQQELWFQCFNFASILAIKS